MGLFGLCMSGVRVWAAVSHVSGEGWTPSGLPFVTDSVQNFYGQNF